MDDDPVARGQHREVLLGLAASLASKARRWQWRPEAPFLKNEKAEALAAGFFNVPESGGEEAILPEAGDETDSLTSRGKEDGSEAS